MSALKAIAAVLAVLVPAPVAAHDFWLQPADLSPDDTGTLSITMFVGHGADRAYWGVDTDYVTNFWKVGPAGETNLVPELRLKDGVASDILFETPGAHLVLLRSRSSESTLEADRFNAYVEEEGLTPIAEYRARNGLNEVQGRELYSRRAKTIVQIGPVSEKDVQRVITPSGLSLEITPQRHPLHIEAGDTLPVQILYDGEPLSGALVKLTDLDADSERTARMRTDEAGMARFTIPHAGQWQMNVVWARRLPEDTRAEFDTVFSSLTFATAEAR